METVLDGWCLAGACIGLAAGTFVGVFVGMRLYWRTGKW